MNANGQPAPNRLKRDLAAGKVCLGATITINCPAVAEIMSHIGLDWLWFETEHSSLTLDNVLTMLQATNGSEVSTVVRVPWNDKTMIKRALDLGPDGIILPLVNSREEAEAAVRAMKYPPWGERGAGLARAQCYGLHMGEYIQTANEEVMTIVMIEHIQAVENINEILKVTRVSQFIKIDDTIAVFQRVFNKITAYESCPACYQNFFQILPPVKFSVFFIIFHCFFNAVPQ